MYAARFWARRFWAARYWPKAGVAVGTSLILTNESVAGDSVVSAGSGDGVGESGGMG
jgi:hypothetical protein